MPLFLTLFRAPRQAAAMATPPAAQRLLAVLRPNSMCCRLTLLMAGACLTATAVAGPFAPDIEMFRLGAGDRLVINRGGPVHNAGDVNGDGLLDVIMAPGVGAARVVYGPTNGQNGRLDVSIQRGIGGFGITGDVYRVGGGQDFNGDGVDDMVAGSASRAWLVYGRRGGFPPNVNTATLDGSDGFEVRTAGDSVALVPDLNGDGLADMVIGSRHVDAPGFRDAGRVTVIYGQRGAMPAWLSPFNVNGSNGVIFYGESTLNLLGWSVESAGDLNNDGLNDLALGAPGATGSGEAEAGRAYAIYGSRNWPTRGRLAALDGSNGFVFEGSGFENVAGYSVRTAGDMNNDGIDDLASGAPGKGPFGAPTRYQGEAYVVFGGGRAARLSSADLNGSNGFYVRGIRQGTVPAVEGVIAWGDQAGSSVSTAGDINADGFDDLIIGAPYTILSNARRGNGNVYVIYGRPGSFPAFTSLADLNGENGFRWQGVGTTDYTGASVSAAGDFNRDGVDDVIVGASGQGESYIFYGRRGPVSP